MYIGLAESPCKTTSHLVDDGAQYTAGITVSGECWNLQLSHKSQHPDAFLHHVVVKGTSIYSDLFEIGVKRT